MKYWSAKERALCLAERLMYMLYRAHGRLTGPLVVCRGYRWLIWDGPWKAWRKLDAMWEIEHHKAFIRHCYRKAARLDSLKLLIGQHGETAVASQDFEMFDILNVSGRIDINQALKERLIATNWVQKQGMVHVLIELQITPDDLNPKPKEPPILRICKARYQPDLGDVLLQTMQYQDWVNQQHREAA